MELARDRDVEVNLHLGLVDRLLRRGLVAVLHVRTQVAGHGLVQLGSAGFQRILARATDGSVS